MADEELTIKVGDDSWDIVLAAAPRVNGYSNRIWPDERQRRKQAWQIVGEAHERLEELGWVVTTSRNPKPVQREQYVDKRSQEISASIEEHRRKRLPTAAGEA